MSGRAMVCSVVCAASLALAACGEPRATTGQVVWEVTTGLANRDTAAGGPSVVLAAPDSAIVALGRDTIVIRRARLVAREVLLQPQRTQECEPEHGEFCGEVHVGVVLLDLPLDGLPREILRAQVAPDVYGVLQVQIYKATVAEDSAFTASHPDFVDRSMQVEGTYSRAGRRGDFTWVSDFNEVQEIALPAVVPLAAGDTVGITLRLDLARWFVTSDGTALLDPSRAVTGAEDDIRVRDNVRRSLDAVATARGARSPRR